MRMMVLLRVLASLENRIIQHSPTQTVLPLGVSPRRLRGVVGSVLSPLPRFGPRLRFSRGVVVGLALYFWVYFWLFSFGGSGSGLFRVSVGFCGVLSSLYYRYKYNVSNGSSGYQ